VDWISDCSSEGVMCVPASHPCVVKLHAKPLLPFVPTLLSYDLTLLGPYKLLTCLAGAWDPPASFWAPAQEKSASSGAFRKQRAECKGLQGPWVSGCLVSHPVTPAVRTVSLAVT
jgi:hypothetical protein